MLEKLFGTVCNWWLKTKTVQISFWLNVGVTFINYFFLFEKLVCFPNCHENGKSHGPFHVEGKYKKYLKSLTTY